MPAAVHGTLIMNGNNASKLKALMSIASIDITLELDMILYNVLEYICEATNAHSGTIMLVDEATGGLRIAESFGLGHDYIERFHEASRNEGMDITPGLQGTALRTGVSHAIPDIFKDPEFRPWYDIYRDSGFSSQISSPMKNGNMTVGLLNVHWARSRLFADHEIDLVADAASHTAIIIQNARLVSGLKNNVREYQEKLRMSGDELIEAERIKIEFISNITHELLTPLTSIKGFTELLRDETSGKINKEQKKNLDIIYRNSARLIGRIRELVDVSNLDKNQFDLQFCRVSMNDIIIRCVKDMHQEAKDKGISIVMKDVEPLTRIWGDKEKLSHVIMNLLTNAIKFTPENGTITIKADENLNEIKISVTDTGIGIPQDKLGRIFDRFYQIDGSTNRRYGGIGLGLSVCKCIMENHYGSIWAESSGLGSTFNIVLPKLAHNKK